MLNSKEFQKNQSLFDNEGYVIFEDVLSQEEVGSYRKALNPYIKQDIKGRNNFEGHKTNRIYAMLAKSEVFGDLVSHPLVMQFVKHNLGDSALLSACLAINLLPGESVQPWHTDDGHIGIEMPHPSFGVSAFWVIDNMTQANGATEIIPKSHLWPRKKLQKYLKSDSIKEIINENFNPSSGQEEKKVIELNAGSLMLTKSTLIHRGGANNSDKPRLIITPQYCFGWCRQLENMIAVIPKEKVIKYSEEVRSLIGYSIHPPFMGYTDGVHPEKLLK